jgi:hypothetical protein
LEVNGGNIGHWFLLKVNGCHGNTLTAMEGGLRGPWLLLKVNGDNIGHWLLLKVNGCHGKILVVA